MERSYSSLVLSHSGSCRCCSGVCRLRPVAPLTSLKTTVRYRIRYHGTAQPRGRKHRIVFLIHQFCSLATLTRNASVARTLTRIESVGYRRKRYKHCIYTRIDVSTYRSTWCIRHSSEGPNCEINLILSDSIGQKQNAYSSRSRGGRRSRSASV